MLTNDILISKTPPNGTEEQGFQDVTEKSTSSILYMLYNYIYSILYIIYYMP